MKHSQKGSIVIKLLVLGALAGGLSYVKDEQGVSYLQKIIGPIKYYLVDRNEDALQQAKEVQGVMQEKQDEIQKMLDE
ncbi:MAG: hypothetical protein RI911_787 [Candidatus Parcubacteria bacterium]